MSKRQALSLSLTPAGMFGASLIEVLVSIVIASIGLLALAGVNAASIRYTKMSQYRATATQLANIEGCGQMASQPPLWWGHLQSLRLWQQVSLLATMTSRLILLGRAQRPFFQQTLMTSATRLP
jgi:hypothetical protein